MFFKVIILAVMLQFSASGILLGASKRYKLEDFFKTDWYMANVFCRYHGMRLASIETAEQQAQIEKLIQDAGHQDEEFWTSGSDLQKEGEWFWYSSGNKFIYDNWDRAMGQPDNGDDNENCMHLYRLQTWNDDHCTRKMYFICEVPSSMKLHMFD